MYDEQGPGTAVLTRAETDDYAGPGTTTVLPPAGPGAPPRTGTATGPEPPRRGVPVWVFVLSLLAVVLIAGVVVLALFFLPAHVVVTGVEPPAPTGAVSAVPSAPAPATAPTATTPAASTKSPAETLTKATVRQITLIKSASGSASAGYKMVLDFMSDLTGTKAGEAWAKAHGQEWPPPNDYYYVNQSKKLRTLAVSPSVKITMTSPDGSTQLHPTLAQFRAHLLSPNPAYTSSQIYWATIVNGTTITKIVQQWVP